MLKNINKRLTFILASGVFILAGAGIAAAYLGQVQEQKRLLQDINTTNAQTQSLSTKNIESQRSTLDVNKLKYETDITVMQGQLTTPLVVSDIFEKIDAIAANSSVRISSISSGNPSTATLSNVQFDCISLDFSAVGSEQALYSFVDSISRTFTTAALKTINLQISGEGTKRIADARLNLTIYSYRGE